MILRRISRAWSSTLACLLVLASALVPVLASASIPAQPETRVRGFDLAGATRVGLEGDLSRTSRQGYEVSYDGIASGSLVAPKSGVTVGKWTGKDVGGRTVYQRSDIFDPAKASSWQDPVSGQWKRGTNVERMADGLAPVGRDGKSVNLHHVLQSEPGPLAEVPSSLHKGLPHKLRGPGESFRNDPALKQQFEDFRGEYWKQRSKDFTSGN